MKNLKLLLILLCAIIPFACDSNSGLDGDCSNPISTSESSVMAEKEAFVKTITVKRDFWFSQLSAGGEMVDLSSVVITDPNFEITGDWYHIKKNPKKVTFTLDKNETGKAREIVVILQDGNCFDSVTIKQKGE